MSQCLLKALKSVRLDQHLGLFRSLGYESAGSLTQFRTEDFERLKFSEQELLRLISLLDALKDGTKEGKFSSHQRHPTSSRTTKKTPSLRANWTDETAERRPSPSSKAKRIGTSYSFPASATQPYLNELIFQRPSTVTSRSARPTPSKRFFPGKLFLHRPAIQHVKAKTYNYGVPTHRRPTHRGHSSSSIFVSSPRAATHESVAFGKPAEIYVYARKRPMLSSESNLQDSIVVPDHQRIVVTENKANLDCSPMLKKTEFQFDHVFSSETTNRSVFEQTVLPFLSTHPRANLTYICFGQTGSGKSHTIFGSRTTDGLLVFCTQLLLREVNETNALICSFYEIYNNQVYDLNHPGKKLFVREDGHHHVNIIGITELAVRNVESLRAIIDEGLSRRHHGKSAFNSNSSRSHAVFQIALKSDDESEGNFRLIFIDLAGSERATDAQNNQRQTRREGAQINCSLLALKECIRSMDMTHSHAPFRQSKLTHILRDSLIGSKTRTCLMANVSPANDCCQCSLNTLQYASRIREISMRHRHRSMPTEVFRETKVQPTFQPATASTPVHRLVSTPQRTIDIDWQPAEDDRRAKPSSRVQKNQPSPSNYFPMPQPNISKPATNKRQYNSSRLMFDNGNERKSVSKETLERRERKTRELLGDAPAPATNVRRTPRDERDFQQNRDNLLSMFSSRLSRSSSVATKSRTLKSSSSSTTTFAHATRSAEKKTPTPRRSPARPLSPFAAATLNNPWLASPTKEFGLKVSEQLTALRNLLETRLTEQTEFKARRIELEPFDGDDDEVAQSFQQIIEQENRSSFDEKEMRVYPPPSLSSLANELNEQVVGSSLMSSGSSTINSNLAAKIAVGTSRSDSEQTSENAPPPFASPLLFPPFCQLDIENTLRDVHEQLIDSGKSNSFVTGSSFEKLLNSLKTIREKNLDFPLRASTTAE